MQTTQSNRTRTAKKNNTYGDDFTLDRIDLKKIVEELLGLEEKSASQDIDIVDDQDKEWIDDRSNPDDEQQQSYKQNLRNFHVLECLNEMISDLKETSVTIQDVECESGK